MSHDDLKRRLESLLFSSGRKLDLEELAKLCKEDNLDNIKHALIELQEELEHKQSSLILFNEGNAWKLTVREQYLSYVKKVVKKTELPKSILETLSVAAFKAPALQSHIIKIRTNKAYKHLDELEQAGYITREKKGRTKLVKMTRKFYDYFELPPEKMQEKFKNIAKLERTIETKEEQIEAHKLEQYSTLEVTDESPQNPLEVVEEKIGALEVYDLTPEKKHEKHPREKKEDEPLEEKNKEEKQEQKKENTETPAEILKPTPAWVTEEQKEEKKQTEKKPAKRMFSEGVPDDVEKKIDEIVEDIVTPKKEERLEED